MCCRGALLGVQGPGFILCLIEWRSVSFSSSNNSSLLNENYDGHCTAIFDTMFPLSAGVKLEQMLCELKQTPCQLF